VWAIAEGDAMTGVTAHRIDTGVDTGRIVDQQRLPIHPMDTGFTLHGKAARLVRAMAARLLRSFLADGSMPEGFEQTGAASVHRLSDPALNHLDWHDGRERIRNITRALAPPLPGAYSFIGDQTVTFSRLRLAESTGSREWPPGTIGPNPGDLPMVWAGDGPLAVEEFVVDGVTLDGRELLSLPGIQPGGQLR
jgi:UDP-4-amino-4-deoxy-L-arabinose formyltransferase/UDP-glucuronic acid dehydrogenase (UDP-4-keto-hexauronic acid decarboxylating)